MQSKTVWQYGSNNPDNADNLDSIRQWWGRLADQEITWRQRLIPESGDISQLNWDPQRFDEEFLLKTPSLRGITLYWCKPDSAEERNITADLLELDSFRQQLYVYPQSQKQVVIQVAVPQVKYQTIALNDPDLVVGKNAILMRDSRQLLEVQINLSPEKFEELKDRLKD